MHNDLIIAQLNALQQQYEIVFDVDCIAWLRNRCSTFIGIPLPYNDYVICVHPIVRQTVVVDITNATEHELFELEEYIAMIHALLQSYARHLHSQRCNTEFAAVDAPYSAKTHFVPVILKPAYPVRTQDKPRQDKTDIQSRECFAIARIIDATKQHQYKAHLIVDDAEVHDPKLFDKDVLCCSVDYVQHSIDKYGVLYIVCSAMNDSMSQSVIYKQHKQLIESWKGDIVWLWYDLRLVPHIANFRLRCKKMTVVTQAQNMHNALSMLTEINVNTIQHARLEGIPLYASHNEKRLAKLQSGKLTTAMPMVAWNDMCAERKQEVIDLLGCADIETHVVGNIDIDMPHVYDGTIKYFDILTYLSQFDFAYIVCEENMKQCNAITFRATESMLAGLPCMYVNNCVCPDFIKYHKVAHIKNAKHCAEVFKSLSVDELDELMTLQDNYLIELHTNIVTDFIKIINSL